ncbi:hypothetical protein Sjap_002338 [Stephania japonica]|uniref:Uncharacterized protein n=1 Tax=Stephania japonica TaxID=461633 RepID=A0AAP0KLR1_9MAGN
MAFGEVPRAAALKADVVGDAEKVVDAILACQSCESKTIHVVVEGIVLCQSCQAAGTSSLAGATPAPSANLNVTCEGLITDQTKFSFSADKSGYFYAELGFKVSNNTLDKPLKSSHVQLVSSPLANCNQTTNINNGIDGAALRSENKRLSGNHYKAAIYAAGPLAFRPAQCQGLQRSQLMGTHQSIFTNFNLTSW